MMRSGLRLDHYFGVDPQSPDRSLGEALSELLELLWAVHPRLSDHYFNHQARLSGANRQSELPL